MSLLNDEKIDKINAYMKAHPNAQDPFDYLRTLGVNEIVRLIDESEGREIKFETVEGSEGEIEVAYA